jgi:hypothetical protein
MYFSTNTKYHYELIDKNKPELGKHFVTEEEMFIIEQKRHINNTLEEQRKKKEFFESLKDTFTEEEIEFLKNNWTPEILKD